jgi:hypothetical protein
MGRLSVVIHYKPFKYKYMSATHYADVSKKPALTQLVSIQFREGQEFTKPTFHYLRAPLIGEFCRFLATATNKTVRMTRPDHELSDVSAYSGSYFNPSI